MKHAKVVRKCIVALLVWWVLAYGLSWGAAAHPINPYLISVPLMVVGYGILLYAGWLAAKQKGTLWQAALYGAAVGLGEIVISFLNILLIYSTFLRSQLTGPLMNTLGVQTFIASLSTGLAHYLGLGAGLGALGGVAGMVKRSKFK